MLSALLLIVAAQVLPCLPAESTVVCNCKQGQLSACEVVRQTDPERFRKLAEALQAVRQTEKLRQQQQAAKAEQAEAQASSSAPEPPDCKGQQHHIISRRIARALEDHKTLRGLYPPRDPRFVTQAVDEKAHCGYQQWHREMDEKVIGWLKDNETATPKQFEDFLRTLYSRPALSARFPHGF